MKRISAELILPKSKIVNERQAILSEFVAEINKGRIGTKWKPVTGRAVALKVSHLKRDDLYAFLSQCRQSKGGFSKCFFGSLKVKK